MAIRLKKRSQTTTLLELALLLLFQFGWLVHSFSSSGNWFAHLDSDVPRGTYTGMSGGHWFVLTLGKDFPRLDRASAADRRFRFAGIQICNGGDFAKFIIVPSFWTIVPTVIWMLWISSRMLQAWRTERQRRRQGLCANCGFDLRATPDICPECGNLVPDQIRHILHQIAAASIPPPT